MKCGVLCLRFKVTNANLCIRNEKEEKMLTLNANNLKLFSIAWRQFILSAILSLFKLCSKGEDTLVVFNFLEFCNYFGILAELNFFKKLSSLNLIQSHAPLKNFFFLLFWLYYSHTNLINNLMEISCSSLQCWKLVKMKNLHSTLIN